MVVLGIGRRPGRVVGSTQMESDVIKRIAGSERTAADAVWCWIPRKRDCTVRVDNTKVPASSRSGTAVSIPETRGIVNESRSAALICRICSNQAACRVVVPGSEGAETGRLVDRKYCRNEEKSDGYGSGHHSTVGAASAVKV